MRGSKDKNQANRITSVVSGFSRTLLAVSVISVAVGAVRFVSVSDEIAIGKQAQARVRRETPEVSDAPVRAFVARVARQRRSLPVQLFSRAPS